MCKDRTHNASGFEQADLFAIGKRVGHSWDTSIGIDGEELTRVNREPPRRDITILLRVFSVHSL